MPELQSENLEKRLSAIRKLALQGDASLDVLEALARPDDPRIRQEAVRGIGGVPSELVGPRLRALWRSDSDPHVRLAAVEAAELLAEEEMLLFGREVVQNECDVSVRMAVARTMRSLTSRWRIDRREIEELLTAFARDPAPEVRATLIREGIVQSHYSDIVHRLSKDPDRRVVHEAVIWMGLNKTYRSSLGEEIRSSPEDARRFEKTVLSLLGEAEHFGKSEQWRTAPLAAIRVAGWYGLEKATGLLLRALRHSDPHFREAAATALGQIGTDACIGALVDACTDKAAGVRQAAVNGLREALQHAASRPVSNQSIAGASAAIGARLKDWDASVRAAAVSAVPVADIPDKPAHVRRAARDRRQEVREAAVRAMGTLGAASFVVELVRLLRDRHVRDLAAAVLSMARTDELIRRLTSMVERP
jgi:HEAT repeat protein